MIFVTDALANAMLRGCPGNSDVALFVPSVTVKVFAKYAKLLRDCKLVRRSNQTGDRFETRVRSRSSIAFRDFKVCIKNDLNLSIWGDYFIYIQIFNY